MFSSYEIMKSHIDYRMEEIQKEVKQCKMKKRSGKTRFGKSLLSLWKVRQK